MCRSCDLSFHSPGGSLSLGHLSQRMEPAFAFPVSLALCEMQRKQCVGVLCEVLCIVSWFLKVICFKKTVQGSLQLPPQWGPSHPVNQDLPAGVAI